MGLLKRTAERPLEVKERDVKGAFERNIHARKGDAGRVLVIAGEERYAGATALASIAALRAGADSVVIAATKSVAEAVRPFSPDVILHACAGATWTEKHVKELSTLAERADVVLLGPGLGESDERAAFVNALASTLKTRLVLDADAAKQVIVKRVKNAIILANHAELAQFLSVNTLSRENARAHLGQNLLVSKGIIDAILAPDHEYAVTGGHPRATVAGTGDVLAGITAGLYAQNPNALLVAKASCLLAKKTAEKLGDEKDYAWIASDLLDALPGIIKELRVYRMTKYEPVRKH